MLIPSHPFLQFDLDGDGSITSDELKHAMIKLLGKHTSKSEIDAVVKEADDNGDGTVDFEGKKHMQNTHKRFIFIAIFLYFILCYLTYSNSISLRGGES